MTRPTPRRCAIYTRKSSDEGLEQEFNSLDAQREAGEAYVKSQASEGWRAVSTRYDDGGFSGGTMERPALKRLLADIEAGLIDVVVVYKIDRLTRSLADFARIVERFDARQVSFVSVTQAFNTTSSMGRLTLNVLLSFAQFEREVTGERIRDKIAASKAKGLWMGGVLPLGYDLPETGSRTLQVNETEAGTVRHIFTRYLELGSVHRLVDELGQRGLVSKQWTTAAGKVMGGVPFSRGAMFHLLRNQLYLGKITHKGAVHPGTHPAIIDEGLFGKVQARLDAQRRRRTASTDRRVEQAPLTGRLFDQHGGVMRPAFSRGRSGRVYRYYVSTAIGEGAGKDTSAAARVSAPAIEKLLHTYIARIVPSASDPLAAIQRVQLGGDRFEVELTGSFAAEARRHLQAGEELVRVDRGVCLLTLPVAIMRRGGSSVIVPSSRRPAEPDTVLISALRRAHRMLERDGSGMPIISAAPLSLYERRILQLAFLAPDLQRDILAGRQPVHVNLEFLVKRELPIAWKQQRRMLGW